MKRKGIKNPKYGIWYNAHKTYWDTEEIYEILGFYNKIEVTDTCALKDNEILDEPMDYWARIPQEEQIPNNNL